MKPILFVDIDGVLNTSKNYSEWNEAHSRRVDAFVPSTERDEDPHVLKLFDRVNVANLNKLTEMVGAEIVISSSWRMFYASKFDRLRSIMERAGVMGRILESTPTIIPDRTSAIAEWLNQSMRPRVPMVILDDYSPSSFRHLRPFHVEVNDETGLVEKDIWRALKILERPWTR